jgi:hypothetical protein
VDQSADRRRDGERQALRAHTTTAGHAPPAPSLVVHEAFLPSSADGTTASRPQRDDTCPCSHGHFAAAARARDELPCAVLPSCIRYLLLLYWMYPSDMPSSGCQPSGSRHNQTRGAWLLKGRVSAASEAANRNGAPNLVHFQSFPRPRSRVSSRLPLQWTDTAADDVARPSVLLHPPPPTAPEPTSSSSLFVSVVFVHVVPPQENKTHLLCLSRRRRCAAFG